MWEPKGYKEPPGDGSASGVKFTWNIAGALVRQIPGGVEHWCAGGHAHEPLSLLFWRFEIWIAIGNLLDNPRFIGAGEIFPKLHAFREESRVQFVIHAGRAENFTGDIIETDAHFLLSQHFLILSPDGLSIQQVLEARLQSAVLQLN